MFGCVLFVRYSFSCVDWLLIDCCFGGWLCVCYRWFVRCCVLFVGLLFVVCCGLIVVFFSMLLVVCCELFVCVLAIRCRLLGWLRCGCCVDVCVRVCRLLFGVCCVFVCCSWFVVCHAFGVCALLVVR